MTAMTAVVVDALLFDGPGSNPSDAHSCQPSEIWASSPDQLACADVPLWGGFISKGTSGTVS